MTAPPTKPAPAPTLREDLNDVLANVAEGYCCDDCNEWVSKADHAYHNPDHTLRKQSMVEGWVAKVLEALASKGAETKRRIEEAVKLINEGIENEVCECAGCKRRRTNLKSLLALLTEANTEEKSRNVG